MLGYEKPATDMIAGFESGTPVGSRTPNLLIRSQTLYPIELRVRGRAKKRSLVSQCKRIFSVSRHL